MLPPVTPPAPAAADGVRLLTLPAQHPYVTAVRPADVEVVRPDRVRGFEPDPYFDPATVAALAGEVDVVHLHFGFDHLDVPAVRRWLAALAAADLPLVLTAHDLRNPHHDRPGPHEAVLAELLSAAAAVLTLTPGAAAQIASRTGVAAVVVPHPTLTDPARTADVTTEPGRVVLHLKSLRRNLLEPVRVVAAAARGAEAAGGRLVVDAHPEVLDDPRLVGLAQVPGLDLHVHPRYTDLELERYLRGAQVTVLPHRWGTHSGWLELARDLGTRVVSPSCGHYADQWPEVVGYRNDEDLGLDEESLTAAVAEALARPVPAPADRAQRLTELAGVRALHARTYARVRG